MDSKDHMQYHAILGCIAKPSHIDCLCFNEGDTEMKP